ncbi:hypothetical protein AGOR_G00093340 [Albula goreensis]|uniref:protein-tyrosine-phosphatase n=1 Tax=Albula goreensis TaxID=1534307 RepID=A0A8T3DLT4_9TELE|nr:hypothetical protein AGOR_G00093340 [Albula goreensis]
MDAKSAGHNFSEVTAPENVMEVNVTDRSETRIELQWTKVSNDPKYNYALQYSNGTQIADIPGSGDGPVNYNVSGLTPGTKYDFTLYTVFMDAKSTGCRFPAITIPKTVDGVNVKQRSETWIELQWNKVYNDPKYDYSLEYENKIFNIPGSKDGPVKHIVSGLTPGTEYNFALFTVFMDEKSTGHHFSSVTTFICSEWTVTNTSIDGKFPGKFSDAHATNDSINVTGDVDKDTVSFLGLYPGSTYNVSLFYQLNNENLMQCHHTLTLVPPNVNGLQCEYMSGGYQFSLSWRPPQGVWTEIVVQMPGRSPHNVTGTETKTVIGKVQPARTYHMTVTSWSRGMKSEPVSFECMTDPRGVIGGSVMGVLLFAVVVLLVVFIFRRKPELLSPKFFVESKISSNNYKPIPIGKFEAHFNDLSCDENRGFSVEYEDFSPVGTEQTCKAAELQQNTVKNRFTNVLPYDWARVKLNVINGDPYSDYINACYMPGYGNNVRQYIAAQGPLPSTVNDFWRMIWEQKVHGIVMVTNCNEGGRVKCDQYWPLDYTPCTYGELLVRVSSENRESSWTLREFVVTNRVTSEVRSVNHFHFTAWPDHGVPNGTTELIQFRALVRQHIERCGSVGPTVVHCSAGVGRTGTLIALDVTLQQMEREKAVGLAAFVHKMRLSRPLMVQTESQYIFLHQCIMDCLKPKLKELPEDPLYENVDTIYINATALKEFHSTNTNA